MFWSKTSLKQKKCEETAICFDIFFLSSLDIQYSLLVTEAKKCVSSSLVLLICQLNTFLGFCFCKDLLLNLEINILLFCDLFIISFNIEITVQNSKIRVKKFEFYRPSCKLFSSRLTILQYFRHNHLSNFFLIVMMRSDIKIITDES